MLKAIEDQRNEFKFKLNKSLEKEIVAFLNSDGGNLYIGIDDDGNVRDNIGNVDKIQRTIKDRIKDNISPSTLGLFDIVVEGEDKKYIKIIIAKGPETPYYIKNFGMTENGCFIRVGSAVTNMSSEMILNLFSKRARNSLKNIKSPIQNLTFSTIKIYYQEKGFEVNDNFLRKLQFYTENNVSIQFAKYAGNDVVNLIENQDFGNCCLIKAMESILNKFNVENKIYTKIETPKRKEIPMFNYDCVKEIVTNALAHNDWSNGYTPKFELFDNKIVISSNGGIQEGVTQDEFLEGFSNPRNPEIMRIFRDLNFVEQLGTGIQRVLKIYPKNIFEFFPNHIRVSIPFSDNTFSETIHYDSLNEIQNLILKLISGNNKITYNMLALQLNVSRRTVARNIEQLVDNGYLERIGSNKKGDWVIKK